MIYSYNDKIRSYKLKNNNIKLVATDLDETLLNENSDISDYNKKVLIELMKNGIEVVLCTGRPLEGTLRYRDYLNTNNDIVVFNGAGIVDFKNNFLYHKPLEENICRKLIPISEKYKVYYHAYFKDNWNISEEDPWFKKYRVKEMLNNYTIGMDRLENYNFTKFIYLGDHKTLVDIKKEVDDKFEVHTTFSHSNYLEVLNKGVTKGSALSWLVNEKGLSSDNVVAFGDNYNDIEMIEYAKIGVAMKNAEKDVKKSADYIAKKNTEDGVGKFLSELFELSF